MYQKMFTEAQRVQRCTKKDKQNSYSKPRYREHQRRALGVVLTSKKPISFDLEQSTDCCAALAVTIIVLLSDIAFMFQTHLKVKVSLHNSSLYVFAVLILLFIS